MGPDILDLVIVVSLVLFTIRGATNGFVGEIAGIGSLVCGFWAARAWGAPCAQWFGFIADPSLRSIVAYTVVFIAVMLAIGLIARLLRKLLALSFAGWIDRFAGALLGLAKGLLVWALIFIVLEKLFQDAPFLRDSRALPYFTAIIDQMRQWLPPELASHI
ncbi:MAG: CvpA family protein [Desulfovibrio sp.]|nr:CvpA family protein [Desulfovibrio sp.]